MSPQAFFLPAENGQRFCLFYPAQLTSGKSPLGQVLYVHPFSEEMNKSRRMVAMQVRALAQIGFDVLQIDLLGCGDSSGDFGDASWTAWVDDVRAGHRWLQAHAEAAAPGQMHRPALWFWGLRAGCLLAAQAAHTFKEPCNFLFWAPTPSGKPLLHQFLRLKAAGDLVSGNAKAVMETMRAELSKGKAVEIAGYLLAPGLASGLEQAHLAPPPVNSPPTRVEWFELSTRDDASLTPVATKAISQWKEAGYVVRSHLVNGPAFWQTTEIGDAPALITATSSALQEAFSP
jgi:exosortase A-associated hydrolase 2